jgi:hypothetical protein
MDASTSASSAGGRLRTVIAHDGPSVIRSLAIGCCLAGWVLGVAGASVAWAADDAPASAPDGATAGQPAGPASAPSTGAASTNTPAPPASEFSDLDKRIEDAKSQVIELNRDLMVLEEELLFPASTQVAVFVSMDVGTLFDLDSVQVKLDDKEVANYLYTPAEVQALHRGGVQRVYLGNLRAGSHELVAFFTGGGPHRRDYRRATSVKFDKGTDPKYIELRIKDSTGKMQPEFDVRIWPGPQSPAPSASE